MVMYAIQLSVITWQWRRRHRIFLLGLGCVMGGARLLRLDGRGGSARTREEGIMTESKRLVGALLLGGPWGSMV